MTSRRSTPHKVRDWPLGAKWRHTAPHGAPLTLKNLNYFKRLFGFKSPSSHSDGPERCRPLRPLSFSSTEPSDVRSPTARLVGEVGGSGGHRYEALAKGVRRLHPYLRSPDCERSERNAVVVCFAPSAPARLIDPLARCRALTLIGNSTAFPTIRCREDAAIRPAHESA